MKKVKLLFICLTLLILVYPVSATAISLTGDADAARNSRFNVTVKVTGNNIGAFQICVLVPEGITFVDASKGRDIKDWGFSYTWIEGYEYYGDVGYSGRVKIIGLGDAINGEREVGVLTFVPKRAKNFTFLIDERNSKLVDPNEKEIKIDEFQNHTIRVYRYGDINMDDEIDVKDLIRLEKIILMKEKRTVTSDINNDGEVNILDLVRLIRVLIK
ncbi:hypothetical protein Asulf_01461 [Archaeoglobus sulfaticallidus PM70-1]|uniref:Dockerin domain-containing protein n=1 Tax=Archaeoglobus sulfaticallidus PM70-1 TaxID=387631 RepID=N0BCV7_9EURY|nr:dockerin type I repeat-containing protein [Archaeoglobus sulfaticallidus]AGK61444.1 hypothetical protein Asulf_01461 [Archaeoglobus sulfaticallidus PM70-1]